MCNVYQVGAHKGRTPVLLSPQALRKLAACGTGQLIRRTDSASVVRADGEVELMSWGFRREGLGVINNSRSDKLEGSMWQDAYQYRRCLVPATHYYEWKDATERKQTYRCQERSGETLWLAGLWEESEFHGRCFSIITTEANRAILPIHHRMPATLRFEQQANYLAGEKIVFGRDFVELVFEKCDNPLLKKQPPYLRGELF